MSCVSRPSTLQTISTLQAVLLALCLHPDVLKKAQAELDRVVGQSRLPDFTDIENMPYIRAVAMETMRWMPVVPFSIPHRVLNDDTYNGYHIPEGAIIVPVSAF